MNRSLKLAATLWTTLQVTACDKATTAPDPGGNKEPPRAVAISDIEPLVPGQTAKVSGKNLDQITQLAIDGQTVILLERSASEVTFTVPQMRACETDGRTVSVLANGTIRDSATVAVEQTLKLEVGESRILSAQDLFCLQLAAAPEGYVLSAHNFSREKHADHVLSLSVSGSGSSGPSFHRAGTGGAPTRPGEVVFSLSAERAMALRKEISPDEAFDPRYASAHVGDVLEFVDWSNAAWMDAESRDEVPTYQGKVVALAGSQMVVVDQRLPNAADFDRPEVRAKLAAAAEIADQNAVPAIRAVVDPAYEPMGGAGGRTLSMIRELSPGVLGGVMGYDLTPQSSSPFSSQMPMLVLDVQVRDLRAGQVAATMIHEQAHIADFAHGQAAPGSYGWFAEALAVNVEETAARMATGQEAGVLARNLDYDRIPVAGILSGPSLRPAHESPWGPAGSSLGATGSAAYDRGARLLHYARERLGEAGFSPAASLLYQRLRARAATETTFEGKMAAWSIDAIAEDIGISAEQLMEEASLAELTDDLIAPNATAKPPLPQLATWDQSLADPTDYRSLSPLGNVIERGKALEGDATLPGGTHQFWYIAPGTGEQGVSIEARDVSQQAHHRVRLTRLR